MVCFLVSGFARSQAELIVSALVTLTTANMDIVYKDMVTKAHQVGSYSSIFNVRGWTFLPSLNCKLKCAHVYHVCSCQEIAVQQLMAHLDSIRKDMVILEKTEFANLRSENMVPLYKLLDFYFNLSVPRSAFSVLCRFVSSHIENEARVGATEKQTGGEKMMWSVSLSGQP